jgi:serine/threonine protein kinase
VNATPELLREGRYAVVRVLGEGSQGATLEAVDKRDGRLVAIKRFSVRGAGSWKEVELAEREARVLASLSHPALPRHIEHFEENGSLYLVMERVEGESLLEIRKRGQRFSRDEVARFLREASQVLDYLHSRAPPVIHRDIKPGNVVRRPDGSFALVDFGSVRDSLKPEGGSTVVGTFGYMAPEQFQGRALPASDVYAVGATAISLLTGNEPEKLPHRGLAIDVGAALGNSDPALVRTLGAMLDPDPDRRATRIEPLLGALGSERPRQRRKRAPDRPRGSDDFLSNPLVLAPVLIALTVASMATWALFELFLPLLLTLLSIAFGPRLRRAALACRDVGRRGRAGLSRAGRSVRDRADGAAARRHATRAAERVRVTNDAEPPRRTRIDGDEEELSEPPAGTPRRARGAH